MGCQKNYCIFWTIRHTPPPQIWEENGGVSYSLNVAYIYIGEILCYYVIKYFTTFFASKFFFLFSSSKT